MPSKNPKKPDSGILYIVATPIGNLEDITLRALRILREVDIIAAESTKHTKGLCSHYDIKTRLISYHQHNHRTRAPELMNKLRAGSRIALVTNAGTPALSDPGALLIKMAVDEGIEVSPLPGASAALAAISVCGLKIDRFVFMGFLSSRQGKRKKELKELADESKTIIFYEAPHRLLTFLEQLFEIFDNRYIVVLRELTKAYEEIIRGNVKDIIDQFYNRELRGEFTIIVKGKEAGKGDDKLTPDVIDRIKTMVASKKSGVKNMATEISEEYNLKYRAVYKEILKLKRAID